MRKKSISLKQLVTKLIVILSVYLAVFEVFKGFDNLDPSKCFELSKAYT